MAYSFQTALVVEKGLNKRWTEIDVGVRSIADLLASYREVYLVLTNPYLVGSVTFDMSANRNLIPMFSWTVDEWLEYNADTTLPVVNGTYNVVYKKARYKDSQQADYSFRRVHPTAHPDVYFPDADLRDLLLTKQGINYEQLHKHSLVSVNGFFHPTEWTNNGLYVRHAGKSGLIANDNSIGILSTINLGSVKYVPITSEMIYKQEESHNLARKAFIDIGENVDSKTVLLCIGGYLHILDGLYRNIGDGQLVVYLDKIRFLQRYIESRERIDLSSVTALLNYPEDSGIPVDAFRREDVITAFLTLPQSFLVILDTPNLITKRMDVEMAGLPGVAITESRPEDLMFFRSGSAGGYRTIEQWGKWVMNFGDVFEHYYRFESTNYLSFPVVDDALEIDKLGIMGKCYLLELGKETLEL